MKRHYLYLTTCKVNGKKYIGQHITHHRTLDKMLNDRYLGSGTILLSAIKKYGRKAFVKEIISVFDNQNDVDHAEIHYIEDNNVLDNRDVWYNRAPGGQYGRSDKHSEFTSERMKEFYADDANRIKCGWLTKADQDKRNEAIKLNVERNRLIRKLKKIQRAKQINTGIADRLRIAQENGYDSWAAYNYTDTDKRSLSREWQRTPIGRFTMSWKKKGAGTYDTMKGYGKYNNEAFRDAMKDRGITHKDAACMFGCDRSTIDNMSRGYITVKGIKKIVPVKDKYYEGVIRCEVIDDKQYSFVY